MRSSPWIGRTSTPDGHSTICASLVTSHGRATPLLWRTVPKALLKDGGRTDEEDALLLRLRAVLPVGVTVTLLADRGFADQALMALLQTWGWSYVIRIRKNITVENATGEAREAAAWLRPDGRAVRLEGARITQAARSQATIHALARRCGAPRTRDVCTLATPWAQAGGWMMGAV